MLARGEIRKKGLLVAEEAIEDPDKFLEETFSRVRNDGFIVKFNEKVSEYIEEYIED